MQGFYGRIDAAHKDYGASIISHAMGGGARVDRDAAGQMGIS